MGMEGDESGLGWASERARERGEDILFLAGG